MFNAIFGNFLFSSRSSAVTEATETQQQQQAESKYSEASTQTSNKVTISTQTNMDECLSNKMSMVRSTSGSSPLDWVIVDKSEAEKCNQMTDASAVANMENINTQTSMIASKLELGGEENLVEMGQQEAKSMENDDVLLGSFFEKNEVSSEEASKKENIVDDDNEKQSVTPVAKKDETWLITPLPCLTSITECSQQRSMIDNDPLENLLIEHPSMSVFMSAKSSESVKQSPEQAKTIKTSRKKKMSVKKQQEKKQPQKEEEDENDDDEILPIILPLPLTTSQTDDQVMQSENTFNHESKVENLPPKKDEKKENEQLIKKQDIKAIIMKRAAEKRKEAEKQEADRCLSSPSSPNGDSSPNSTLRKKEKKNKKSYGSNGNMAKAGKENVEVKSLLVNEFKKAFCPTANGSNRGDLTLYNKNQMRRNNNNATFSMRNSNTKQRKFHQLQQPVFSYNFQQI